MSEPRRVYSLDVFRGITICLMIIVNTPGSWAFVYSQLSHAKWHGCSVADFVFPFFLFIVGASMRFAFVKWHHYPSKEFYSHILKRTCSIFFAGIMLNAFPFIRQDWDWSEFRYLGVLQRIALSYGLSALLIIKFDFKQLIQILASLLLFYWAILWIGGGEFPYSLEDNLVRKIDLIVLGKDHLYGGFGVRFDPEGILSTIPSIGSVIIGYLMGGMLHTTKNYNDCAKRMFIFGCITSMVGYVWGFALPINKPLWTSSYVLFTGGIAATFLSILTYLIDIKNWKKSFWIFEVFGSNAIFLFILSGLWIKTITRIKLELGESTVSAYHYLYKTVFYPIGGDVNGSLLFAIAHVLFYWVILFWLYINKIKVKL